MGVLHFGRRSLLALACAGCSVPPGAPATVQRPSFTFSPATTAAGTWELEAGAVVQPDDYGELPMTWKYGLDAHTEVSIAVSPLVQVNHATGFGDLGLGWRHRLVDAGGSKPAFALLAAAKLPTANERRGLGSGEPDVFAGATVGGALGRFGWNAYLQVGALGVDHESPDLARDAALLGSWTFDPRHAVFVELLDRSVHETDTHIVQARIGHSITMRPDFVVDWAVYAPLKDDAPDTQFAIGFTRNLGGQ